MLAAVGLIVVAGVFLAYRSIGFRSNTDVFAESVGRLDATYRSRVEGLVKAETSGMTRNEESGVVYYHSQAITGEKNRVYVLWWIVCPSAPEYAQVGDALPGEKVRKGDVAVVAYVDLGFHSFRTRHGKMLSRFFDEYDLAPLRGMGYVWDENAFAWERCGPIENDRLLSLLSAERKQVVREGTYNAVYRDAGGAE